MLKLMKRYGMIKSASPYSFEKKFGEDGGFNEVVKDDTFEVMHHKDFYMQRVKAKT